MTQITGECMCGNASYVVSSQALMSAHCHCSNCRKLGTTAHSSLFGIPRDALAVSGALRRFSWKADSGHTVTKNFCPDCGCVVYLENDGMTDMYMLPASLMDDPELFTPELVVYSSRAASWDQPAKGLPAFPEMPPMPA